MLCIALNGRLLLEREPLTARATAAQDERENTQAAFHIALRRVQEAEHEVDDENIDPDNNLYGFMDELNDARVVKDQAKEAATETRTALQEV